MCLTCDGLGDRYDVRSRAAGSRRQPVVQGRRVRAARRLARHGPLAAAHLSKAWPTRSSDKRSLAKGTMLETAWQRPRSASCRTRGSGAPATSTSRSPGARRRQGTEVRRQVRGDHPELLVRASQARRARSSSGSSKSTCACMGCGDCHGARLNRAGPGGHARRRGIAEFAAEPQPIAARSLRR